MKNSKDAFVDGFGGSIGPATNGVAEYRALVEGLHYALSLGIRCIRGYIDCEFIVEQINGKAKVNQEDLKGLHQEVCDLVKKFAPKTGFRPSWVPRERNREADALVSSLLYK